MRQDDPRSYEEALARPAALTGASSPEPSEQQQAALVREQLGQEQALRREADRERQRVSRIFEHLPAAVAILGGPHHLLEFMNARARGLFGDDALGRPFAEAFPDFAADLGHVLDRAYATGEPVEVREWETTHPRWSAARCFHVTVQPMCDDAGAVTGILAHAVEITEQVRARQERELLVQELQRTVRYNETFTGMLGHDLRNPLTAIKGAAQLALHRRPGPQLELPLSRIVQSADRMSRMIEQLLDFTRIRVGRGIELQPAPMNLIELCFQIIAEFEGTPAWTIEIDAMGDTCGTWDGDRLSQVISNLVSNGVRHGDPSAPLRLLLDGVAEDSLRLLVHNRGDVPAELISTLFEPFRGTQHRRDQSRGLGLGLYITQQIVLAHGGSIDVTSSPEAGTEFAVALPRHVPAAAPASAGG